MILKPIELMINRITAARDDSDAAYFYNLIHFGEFIIKLVTVGMLSALEGDRENHRYRVAYNLVRADGIGGWTQALDDILNGLASQTLLYEAQFDKRVMTERKGAECWQNSAVRQLYSCMKLVNPSTPQINTKTSLKNWFDLFPQFRNKTKGHGATTASMISMLCPILQESINIIVENLPILKRRWLHLHRNLSGKYKVSDLGLGVDGYTNLRGIEGASFNFQNGIYLDWGDLRKVDLLHTNQDLTDFFFPNGAFDGKKYELHSLITDDRKEEDAAPYLASASQRPNSETHGLTDLDFVGQVYSNIPDAPSDYVSREELEDEILDLLRNDRHAIVTLVGRGGIGKTSLAIQTLKKMTQETIYDAIIWFSARDVDLLPQGAKVVKPQITTERDIATEFSSLLGDYFDLSKYKTPLDFMAASLRKSCTSGPILFVFDNFETIRNPIDVFQWIDSNIRLPNKAMITSRFRDFKADYPVPIGSMKHEEALELVNNTARHLNIIGSISEEYKNKVIDESDSHPYVIKMILGENSRGNISQKPERIISRRDDILEALFERTFNSLSPLASRIFLTLSAWRSLVPQLALEAVVLRNQSERIDPATAVDELVRMSLIQRTTASDGTDFLETPLTAAIFGSKKLSVSPIKIIIENDLGLLRDIGPTDNASAKKGFKPKIETLFRRVANRCAVNVAAFDEYKATLEFIASNYPPAWLLLADMQEELHRGNHDTTAAEYLRRYLEQNPDGEHAKDAWARLANKYRNSGDIVAALGAFQRAFSGPDAPFAEISSMAHWLNNNRDSIGALDSTDKASVFSLLISIMEKRRSEHNATDLSRLAWLYLHLGDNKSARSNAEAGRKLDPSNIHCVRLLERLQ